MLDKDTSSQASSHTQSPGGVGRTPGELLLDHQLVERAVAELERIHVQKGLETLVAIGRCLLAHFFDGDISAYRSKCRRHISFRKLSEHPRLPFSHSRLRLAMAVLEQLGQLPQDVGWSLSVSHHRALLPIQDVATKLELAIQSVGLGWSCVRLSREVAKRAAPPPAGARGGRPPLPDVVKRLRKLSKALDEPDFDQADHALVLEGFSTSELEALLERIDAHRRLVRTALSAHLAGTGPAELGGEPAQV